MYTLGADNEYKCASEISNDSRTIYSPVSFKRAFKIRSFTQLESE